MANILLSGATGDMTTLIAERLIKEGKYNLLPFALTGPKMPARWTVSGKEFELIPPERHESVLAGINKTGYHFPIIIDFRKGDSINEDIKHFCNYGFRSIIGTTSGDRKALLQVPVDAGVLSLVVENFNKQVGGLQLMLEDVVKRSPECARGCGYSMTESHQAGKPDFSGTALKFARNYFNRITDPIDLPGKLSIKELEEMHAKGLLLELKAIRNVEEQKALGVPEEFLGGHAWHTYEFFAKQGTDPARMNTFWSAISDFIRHSPVFEGYKKTDASNGSGCAIYTRTSPDGTVMFKASYNPYVGRAKLEQDICGRSSYVDTVVNDAIPFLLAQPVPGPGEKGHVFNMNNILQSQQRK